MRRLFLFPRFFSLWLILSLALPTNPAFALRQLNAGAEENRPLVDDLSRALKKPPTEGTLARTAAAGAEETPVQLIDLDPAKTFGYANIFKLDGMAIIPPQGLVIPRRVLERYFQFFDKDSRFLPFSMPAQPSDLANGVVLASLQLKDVDHSLAVFPGPGLDASGKPIQLPEGQWVLVQTTTVGTEVGTFYSAYPPGTREPVHQFRPSKPNFSLLNSGVHFLVTRDSVIIRPAQFEFDADARSPIYLYQAELDRLHLSDLAVSTAGAEERPTKELRHDGPVYSISYSRNRSFRMIVTAGSGNRVYLWDQDSGTRLFNRGKGIFGTPIEVPKGIPILVAMPRANHRGILVVTPQEAFTAEYSTAMVLEDSSRMTFSDPFILPLENYAAQVTPSPGRTSLAVIEDDAPDVRIQNLAPERKSEGHPIQIMARLKPLHGKPTAVAYRPVSRSHSKDGQILAVGTDQGAVELWGLHRLRLGQGVHRTKTVFKHGEGAKILAIAFAQDGNSLASTDNQGELRLWLPKRKDQGRRFVSLRHSTGEEIHAVVFSPDGKTLASAGKSGEIYLWNLESFTHRTISAGGPVNVLTFSPDGKEIAAATSFSSKGHMNHLVRTWEVAAAGAEEKAEALIVDANTQPENILEFLRREMEAGREVGIRYSVPGIDIPYIADVSYGVVETRLDDAVILKESKVKVPLKDITRIIPLSSYRQLLVKALLEDPKKVKIDYIEGYLGAKDASYVRATLQSYQAPTNFFSQITNSELQQSGAGYKISDNEEELVWITYTQDDYNFTGRENKRRGNDRPSIAVDGSGIPLASIVQILIQAAGTEELKKIPLDVKAIANFKQSPTIEKELYRLGNSPIVLMEARTQAIHQGVFARMNFLYEIELADGTNRLIRPKNVRRELNKKGIRTNAKTAKIGVLVSNFRMSRVAEFFTKAGEKLTKGEKWLRHRLERAGFLREVRAGVWEATLKEGVLLGLSQDMDERRPGSRGRLSAHELDHAVYFVTENRKPSYRSDLYQFWENLPVFKGISAENQRQVVVATLAAWGGYSTKNKDLLIREWAGYFRDENALRDIAWKKGLAGAAGRELKRLIADQDGQVKPEWLRWLSYMSKRIQTIAAPYWKAMQGQAAGAEETLLENSIRAARADFSKIPATFSSFGYIFDGGTVRQHLAFSGQLEPWVHFHFIAHGEQPLKNGFLAKLKVEDGKITGFSALMVELDRKWSYPFMRVSEALGQDWETRLQPRIQQFLEMNAGKLEETLAEVKTEVPKDQIMVEAVTPGAERLYRIIPSFGLDLNGRHVMLEYRAEDDDKRVDPLHITYQRMAAGAEEVSWTPASKQMFFIKGVQGQIEQKLEEISRSVSSGQFKANDYYADLELNVPLPGIEEDPPARMVGGRMTKYAISWRFSYPDHLVRIHVLIRVVERDGHREALALWNLNDNMNIRVIFMGQDPKNVKAQSYWKVESSSEYFSSNGSERTILLARRAVRDDEMPPEAKAHLAAPQGVLYKASKMETPRGLLLTADQISLGWAASTIGWDGNAKRFQISTPAVAETYALLGEIARQGTQNGPRTLAPAVDVYLAADSAASQSIPTKDLLGRIITGEIVARNRRLEFAGAGAEEKVQAAGEAIRQYLQQDEIRKMLLSFENLRMDPAEILFLNTYFSKLDEGALRELGLKVGRAQLIPPAVYDKPPVYAPSQLSAPVIGIYVDEQMNNAERIKDNLERQIEQDPSGRFRLVEKSEARSAAVVVSDHDARIRPGQVLVDVLTESAVDTILLGLMAHMDGQGFLAVEGGVIYLYKGDQGEDVALFV